MRIDQTLDPSQGQASQPPRVAAPPANVPPRRVQAIGQSQSGDETTKVAAAPPDDAILLNLSPEGREAARKAALESLRKQKGQDGSGPESPHGDAQRSGDQQRIEELRERDREERAREQAMRAAAGTMSAAKASYTYQVGPDGRLYVVESEVKFDTSEVPGDPEATLRKAEQIQRAALATGEATPEDRAAAAMAAMVAARARHELRQNEKKPEPDGQEPGV